MTRTQARLGIGAGLVAIVVVLAFTAITLAGGRPLVPPSPSPSTSIEIVIKYSKFVPEHIVVPVGVPVTIALRNDDPIDHEWIVGDEGLHARHRTGTEPVHDLRPTEVTIGALQDRRTVVTFAEPGTLTFICHLPGHEAYGMTGTLTVTPG
jgi:uncharacterized cupredoxin-like copper-binding protein